MLKKDSSCSPSLGRRGNLTGPSRILNDLVVGYHNVVQKWRCDCLVDGIRAIQAIQNNSSNVEDVEKNCEKLSQIVESMRSLLAEMRESERKLMNLALLHKSKSSPCFSWSYEDIAQAVQEVNCAFETEMNFRQKLVFSLRARSSKELDAVAILWLHCGQIDGRPETILEAILRECALSL
jgi:hypothetical protein